MPHALILEFGGADVDLYNQVNKVLNIDPTTGEGDWPQGMISHTGASGGPESFTVFEVWDSRAAQEKFMAERLRPALQEIGVPAPYRVQWLAILGQHSP